MDIENIIKEIIDDFDDDIALIKENTRFSTERDKRLDCARKFMKSAVSNLRRAVQA